MPPPSFLFYALIAVASINSVFRQELVSTIEQVTGALTSGATKVIVNAWIEVAVVAAGLGFLVWIAESKTAKHMGQEVSAPPVESIHVTAPPTLGSSSGYSAGSGGVTAHSNVTAGAGGSSSRGVGTPGRSVKKTTTTKKSSAFGD